MNNSPEQSPISGQDGPYPAPVETPAQTVRPEWIDYNGHMNVGYYGIAFDLASDVLFSEYLGVGVEHVQATGQGPYVLQSHQNYLREMHLNEVFSVRFRLIDHDTKRLHLFGQMVSDQTGMITATQEVMVMNVDHKTGRSAPYPDWAIRRFSQMKADHLWLDPPPQLASPLGIR